MKEFRLILRATLRAAVWKSTPAPPSVTIRAVFIWIIASIAAEAARQYFAIDEAAGFSIYGINSIIAEMAVLVAVALLFFSPNRTAALAQLFALIILAELVSIVAGRLPAIAAATVLVAVGLLFFSRNRTAVLSKLFALAVLAELLAIAVTRLPAFDLMAGMWTATNSTVLSFILLLVWWIGAATAILRNTLGPYESPFLRALGLTVTSAIAIALLPAFPTFVGGDFDLSSYNLWEWTYAKFDRGDRKATPQVDTAAIELSQPSLVEAEVKRLLPEQKGKADIYAIGIAGWSDQDVFIKELNGGLAALDKAIGLDRGTVRLVNHADTTETLPSQAGRILRRRFAPSLRS